jgi:hypothetical protein
MSIRVMTAIWDCKAYEGGTLLVLLAMADWADDTGGKVYPKLDTLAEKARLSIRQTQYCLGRLKADGAIEQVAPARRGKGAEYKIVLDRVQKLHRNECTAISSGEADRADGVQSATVGVQSATLHIDKPSEEPSVTHQRARDGWAEVWAAFKTWPGFSVRASEHLAKAAWERMAAELPLDLVARIRAFGDALAQESARRGRAGPALAEHPHNWLEKSRGWEAVVVESVDQAKAEWARDRADRYFKRGKYAEKAE